MIGYFPRTLSVSQREQLMSVDKYPSVFSCQMEVIVYVYCSHFSPRVTTTDAGTEGPVTQFNRRMNTNASARKASRENTAMNVSEVVLFLDFNKNRIEKFELTNCSGIPRIFRLQWG